MFSSLGNSISRKGLVGEWLLDGNANATVGSNGTASNVTWIKTYKGYQSQAASFNGTSSTITVPISLSGGIASIGGWIKVGTTKTDSFAIFVPEASSYGNFGINIRSSDGTATVYRGNGNSSTNTSPVFNCQLGTVWNHIMYVRTNSGDFFYLNGNLIYNRSISGGFVNVGSTLHISSSYGGLYFSGNIQGVRYYNTELTQNEIQLLYLEGQKLLGPTNIAKYPKLFEGLVGYWDFRGTAHNLVDGVLATVSGATLTTDRFGNSNSAYSFNGSSNYINISSSTISTLINGRNPFNIEMIVKFNNFTGIPVLIDGRDTDYNGAWLECYTGGILKFFRSDGSVADITCQSTNALSTGVWYHIVVTYDGTTAKLYQNGVKQTDGTSTRTLNSATNINLGSGLAGGTRFAYLNGIIDICCIYQINVKTQDEVSTLYNLTSQDYIYPNPSYDLLNLRDGLVLDLNEQGKDLSGNGNHGTLVNGPVVVRQGRTKGLSYNGSNQGISIPDNTNILNGVTTLAANVWCKTSSNAQMFIFAGWEYGPWLIKINSSFNVETLIRKTGTTVINSTTRNISDGKWHMITLVYDGTNHITYVDGFKIMEQAFTGGLTYLNTPGRWNVGFNDGTGGDNQYFNGNIFNPRIRNRALSAKEVQQLYFSQKANFIY